MLAATCKATMLRAIRRIAVCSSILNVSMREHAASCDTSQRKISSTLSNAANPRGMYLKSRLHMQQTTPKSLEAAWKGCGRSTCVSPNSLRSLVAVMYGSRTSSLPRLRNLRIFTSPEGNHSSLYCLFVWKVQL